MNIAQSLYAESMLIIFILSALLVDRFLGKKFISLPSLPLPLKSKMAAIISVTKSLSTRSPKLRLLYRLGRGWYFFRV